ncbi:MAG: hypothetical protein QF668_02930 [Arenicellales bacterium]|jgi:hypothetical protein|nr:hypothetical protein [Arenicellales bacterium]|tara:strand:+ start:15752 stop:15922 length:171 start_codon:yes stop_codon:yes gene_type:complete
MVAGETHWFIGTKLFQLYTALIVGGENAQLKLIMAEQMDALLARITMLEGVQVATN